MRDLQIAIGNCLRLGYKPWKRPRGVVRKRNSLRSHIADHTSHLGQRISQLLLWSIFDGPYQVFELHARLYQTPHFITVSLDGLVRGIRSRARSTRL